MFLDVYKEQHPADLVEEMNLWKIYFPDEIGEALSAKYAVVKPYGNLPDYSEAFRMVERYVDHFRSADKYLLSIPTWTYGVPYVLKEYIDVITQLGLLFDLTKTGGFVGLVTNRPACVLYAGDGVVGPGSRRDTVDLQVDFMEGWLRLIGFTDVCSILDEPFERDPQLARQAKRKAKEEVIRIARRF